MNQILLALSMPQESGYFLITKCKNYPKKNLLLYIELKEN